MFIVLGATGHVGSEVVDALLKAGEPVTAVVRDAAKTSHLQTKGVIVAVADVTDIDALRSVLRKGRRAFLLNPPAPVSGDTDMEERRTASAIAEAINGVDLEKVVVESTYGAQPGRNKGDLSVLFELEEALHAQPVPVTVQRAAYYMSNWDLMLESARKGVLPSMFPSDFELPMVAPADLGAAAARFLREPAEQAGVHYIEGPARYTPRDVADAFAAALGQPVEVAVTPREGLVDAFRQIGFSKEAAKSYAGMTATTLDGNFAMPTDPVRGPTSLTDYIRNLVARG